MKQKKNLTAAGVAVSGALTVNNVTQKRKDDGAYRLEARFLALEVSPGNTAAHLSKGWGWRAGGEEQVILYGYAIKNGGSRGTLEEKIISDPSLYCQLQQPENFHSLSYWTLFCISTLKRLPVS